MFATSLALIGQEFHGKDRATAFGVWGATIGGAVAIGPLVGGVITEHLGWEWIFFVNVPIGLTAIVLTELQAGQRRRPGPGSGSTCPAWSPSRWPLPADLRPDPRQPRGLGQRRDRRLAGRRGGAAARLRRDRGAQQPPDARPRPVPQARLQRRLGRRLRPLGGMFAMFLYLTIYMQGVLGYSPLEAGLRFLPLTVLSFIASPIAGTLSHRIPIRVLLGVGLGTVGVGLLLMHGVSADSSVDDAACRLPHRRRRDRHHQPRHRPGGDRRRPGGESGDGLGHQHDLPPGRDRHRRRRARRRSSSRGSTRSSPSCCRNAPHGLAELVSSGGSRAAAAVAPPGARPKSPMPPRSPSSAASTRSS